MENKRRALLLFIGGVAVERLTGLSQVVVPSEPTPKPVGLLPTVAPSVVTSRTTVPDLSPIELRELLKNLPGTSLKLPVSIKDLDVPPTLQDNSKLIPEVTVHSVGSNRIIDITFNADAFYPISKYDPRLPFTPAFNTNYFLDLRKKGHLKGAPIGNYLYLDLENVTRLLNIGRLGGIGDRLSLYINEGVLPDDYKNVIKVPTAHSYGVDYTLAISKRNFTSHLTQVERGDFQTMQNIRSYHIDLSFTR